MSGHARNQPASAQASALNLRQLVIALGIVLFVLLGWRLSVGNFLLGLFTILYAYLFDLDLVSEISPARRVVENALIAPVIAFFTFSGSRNDEAAPSIRD